MEEEGEEKEVTPSLKAIISSSAKKKEEEGISFSFLEGEDLLLLLLDCHKQRRRTPLLRCHGRGVKSMEEKTFFLKEEMSLSFSSRVMTEEKIFYISYSCIATEEEEIFSSFSFSFITMEGLE